VGTGEQKLRCRAKAIHWKTGCDESGRSVKIVAGCEERLVFSTIPVRNPANDGWEETRRQRSQGQVLVPLSCGERTVRLVLIRNNA